MTRKEVSKRCKEIFNKYNEKKDIELLIVSLLADIYNDFESGVCKNCKHNFCGCSIQDMILEFKNKYGIESSDFDNFGCNKFERKTK